MVQKIIIDADAGIGDALAIAVALFDPDVDVLAVTAVAGAVSGETATRNILAIIENLDPPKWPRRGQSSESSVPYPASPHASLPTAAGMNGATGLGDYEFQVADLHNPHESAKVLTDIVRDQPDEVTLLTLGPLTNVERACERSPEFLGNLKGLCCLGGSVDVGGDATATAEYNILADPEAARSVLRAKATKTLMPLDVSGQAVLTYDLFDRCREKPTGSLGSFLAQLLPFAFRAHHEICGLEGIALRELTALCFLSSPRLFQTRSMMVDVETSGELTRGMTVIDRRGIPRSLANIEVVCDVDTQGVLDYFSRVVAKSA